MYGFLLRFSFRIISFHYCSVNNLNRADEFFDPTRHDLTRHADVLTQILSCLSTSKMHDIHHKDTTSRSARNIFHNQEIITVIQHTILDGYDKRACYLQNILRWRWLVRGQPRGAVLQGSIDLIGCQAWLLFRSAPPVTSWPRLTWARFCLRLS